MFRGGGQQFGLGSGVQQLKFISPTKKGCSEAKAAAGANWLERERGARVKMPEPEDHS